MPTSRFLVGDEGGLPMYGIAWPSRSKVLASRRASSKDTPLILDLGKHLNLERGDAETIRIAFGREVAQGDRVHTKGPRQSPRVRQYAP